MYNDGRPISGEREGDPFSHSKRGADEVVVEEGAEDAPLYPDPVRSENGERPVICSVSDFGFVVLDGRSEKGVGRPSYVRAFKVADAIVLKRESNDRSRVGLPTCGYSYPDPIVEGTTRRAVGHKSVLSDAKPGLFMAGNGSRFPDPVNGEGKGNNLSVILTAMTINGASGLIVAGSVIKSPDPVGCGNEDRPMGSHGLQVASILRTEMMKGGKGGLNLGYHIDDKASTSPTVKRIGALNKLTPAGEIFGLCGDEQGPGITQRIKTAAIVRSLAIC